MIRLRELRKAAGYRTQQALATASGVPQHHITKLETGKIRTPTLPTAHKLARALRVPMEALLPGSVALPPPQEVLVARFDGGRDPQFEGPMP